MESKFEVVYSTCDRQLTEAEFMNETKDFDAVITGWGHPCITAAMLSGSKVKVIAHVGGSVGDLIDPSVFEETNVRVLSGNLLVCR